LHGETDREEVEDVAEMTGVVTQVSVQRTIQGMVRKLIEHYAPQKVILFGSYAYGEPHSESDIDLLIIKETSERFIDRWVRVRQILSDPNRFVSVETIVLTPQEVARRLARGDQYLADIMNRGKVLYAS